MKAKTIKKVLKAKIEEWASSVKDKTVADKIRKGTIITGGSIASMLLKESVNDFDVYFKNIETATAVASYYIDEHNGTPTKVSYVDEDSPLMYNDGANPSVVVDMDEQRVKLMIISKGVEGEVPTAEPFNSSSGDEEKDEAIQDGEVEEDKTYAPLFLSQNAITLTDKIQIIIRFFGTPDEIHENYDFTHCTNWWSSWDNHLELRKEALECLLSRELKYQGSKYPLCSIIRTRKFIKRGWQINAGQYLKMCMQLNEFNLFDVKVLEDQLTGVDVTYFETIISAIRNKKDKEFDAEYVVKLVDAIF